MLAIFRTLNLLCTSLLSFGDGYNSGWNQTKLKQNPKNDFIDFFSHTGIGATPRKAAATEHVHPPG